MDNEIRSYRKHLVQAEQKSVEAYDKALLALSGGALAVSFTFVDELKELFTPGPIEQVGWLVAAWIAWTIAIALTVFSFYCSHRALRRAIRQTDVELEGGTPLDGKSVGGWWSKAIHVVNAAAGISFVGGLGFMIRFAAINLVG